MRDADLEVPPPSPGAHRLTDCSCRPSYVTARRSRWSPAPFPMPLRWPWRLNPSLPSCRPAAAVSEDAIMD